MFLVLASFSAQARKSVVECQNVHANGSKIKLEFINGDAARVTIEENGKSRNQLLEVVSKSRKGIFLKTDKGTLLKLAAIDDSIELSQTASAFDLNFETATCSI